MARTAGGEPAPRMTDRVTVMGVTPPFVPVVEVSEVPQPGGVTVVVSVVTAQEIVNVTASLGAGPSKLMVALAELPVMPRRLPAPLPGAPAGVRAAGSPTTAKLLLVATVSDPSAEVRVKGPDLVGSRLENVAIPPEADTLVVEFPANAPPLLTVILTAELSEVSRFPNGSSTWTVTAGVIACPAVVVVGC